MRLWGGRSEYLLGGECEFMREDASGVGDIMLCWGHCDPSSMCGRGCLVVGDEDCTMKFERLFDGPTTV